MIHGTGIPDSTHASTPDPSAPAGPRAQYRNTRPLLWALLLISITGNIVTSASSHILIQAAFGVLTLASGTALVVHHYQRR